MIQSHLSSEINYPEEKELDDSDINFDTQMWSYEIMGVEVYIALGQKHTIDNIDSFAIYLIKDDMVDSKIGLFEVVDSDTYRDSDGDIDINQLSKPLIFSFVTKGLLEDSLKTTPTSPEKETTPTSPEKETTPTSPEKETTPTSPEGNYAKNRRNFYYYKTKTTLL